MTKYEYKLGDGAWQDVPKFTGLQPGTKYTVYARIKDMPDTEVSAEFVTALTVALSKDTEVLTAGTTLSTDVTGGNNAKFKYTWYRSDSEDFDDEGTTLIKKTYTLEAGRNAKIKARLVLKRLPKKTLPGVPKFRYQSTDRSVATVTKSGRIKAVSKGNCTIYVFAPNGCTKIVKVIVK